MKPFTGSYRPGDVGFLLKPLSIEPLDDVEAKERLIQSGEKHYSEIIGREALPSQAYFDLYEQSLERNAPRVAADLIRMAETIRRDIDRPFVLVSLVRAGTPFGVLLRRYYSEHLGLDIPHYSVSIIRDRGIDANALDYIRERHPEAVPVFIDGWTGKGAITKELGRTISEYNASRGADLLPLLYVLVDLAGVADGSGSSDDYLIPSAILNGVVSGLVSRSILNEQVGEHDWHGCLIYDEWRDKDRSLSYVDRVLEEVRKLSDKARPGNHCGGAGLVQSALMTAFVERLLSETATTDRNRVKPGIGEATRAVLRRAPECVYVADETDPDLAHLVLLCRERDVPIQQRDDMPVKAATLIRRMGDV